MTTKSNWQAVHDQMIAEERTRLGDPPTSEEVLAYMKGELSEADETRVRALLVAYPELARTLTHPFPAEGEGEPFSEEELSRHFAELQKRVRPAGSGQVISFRAMSAALAAVATLALVLGALLWEARSGNEQPYLAAEAEELLPNARRGGSDSAESVGAAHQPFALKISVADQSQFATYRLEIVDEETQRKVWTSEATPRPVTETFIVNIPGIDAGRYALVLYGVDGERQEHLAEYAFRVPGR